MEIIASWIHGSLFECLAKSYAVSVSAPIPLTSKVSATPFELLLMSFASSAGIEVVDQLHLKNEKFDSFEVVAKTDLSKLEQLALPTVHLSFLFTGQSQKISLVNAVEHSQYLSRGVGYFLKGAVRIDWDVTLNGENIAGGLADYANKDRYKNKNGIHLG